MTDLPDFDELLADVGHTDTTQIAVELIDWDTIHDHGDELVDGLLIPGRWTALAAKAKAGKTTLEMFVTVEISEGRDPFDATPREPVRVLYVDGEMGRFDLEERLREMGHTEPRKLTRWHATDLPPRLDTIEGGNALVLAAQQLAAQVVVIDGINGTVTGAERDDVTWRAFYDFTIMPLKRVGVAILTGDNLGKDESLGPRGSSVKLDKPDAVIRLTRTDNGVKLATTHRRTSAYPSERTLSIDGLNGDRPIAYRSTNNSWPAGTAEAATLLDELGVPLDHGRDRVRRRLSELQTIAPDPQRLQVRNDALAAAIRYRKLRAADTITSTQTTGDRSGDRSQTTLGTACGDRSTKSGVDQGGDRFGDRWGQVTPDVGTGGAVLRGTATQSHPTTTTLDEF